MTSLNSIWNNTYSTFTWLMMIIAIVVFVWFRAGSVISLLERLWRLIAGKGEVTDPKLMKFTREMRDVEQFNFVYGLKVKSTEQMHQVIEWIGQHKLGFNDVISAKKWIDIQTMSIHLPTKSYLNWRAAGFALCAVLLALSSITLGSKSALLQFKDSKVWFFLDEDEAQGLKKDWILEAIQCDRRENKKLVPELTENEIQVICNSFKDKELSEFLEKSLHSQRVVSGVIFSAFLMWMIILVIQTQSYHAAKKIQGLMNQGS